jgi:pilus assembly protein CpaF
MLELEVSVPGMDPFVRRVGQGQHSIGRSLGADIRLKHASVARRHAVLSVEERQATLKDLGAADSVQCNGVVVSRSVPVRPGDTLRIGGCVLRVIGDVAAQGQKNPTEEWHPMESPLAVSPITEGATRSTRDDALRPLQEKLQALVVRELDLFRRTALNQLGHADLRAEARTAIESVIASGAIQLPPHIDRARFTRDMAAEIIGYGPIEPYLADDTVSEIMVNGPSQVYVEREGRLVAVNARFINDESLLKVIERIVSPLGRRIDEGAPMVDARLPDGSRVNAIIRPLSLIGPILTIRKFAKSRFSMQRLVDSGALSSAMAEFLRLCVKYRKNIIVSGGTGSGKTTFLNALSEFISPYERIVTIEDAAELRLMQPHVLSLEARPANVEGRGEVTIRDLVRNALRMRPDRIIVGECRGGEALDMLQAMNTGHDGSLTTGHANSPRDLLSRLEVMVLMAGMDLPVRAIREQIASAVDIIVQQTRFSDGRRRVTSIVEVDGMERDVILTQPLFTFVQRGISANGDILGEHTGLGHAPRFYEDLSDAGIVLDRSIFGDRNPCAAN